MKKVLSIFTLLLCFQAYSIAQNQKFNLNFEKNVQDNTLPNDWIRWGSYPLSVDDKNPHSGKYAAFVSNGKAETAFGSMAYRIPAKYKGKSITLEGYMKTENVADGFAGLLMRLDGEGGSLAFDNMQKEGIKGTNDWTKYKIELPYSTDARYIYVAGILVGTGKAWFDDFSVFIDGKDLQTLEEVERALTKVEMDKEFDDGSKFELNQPTQKELDNLFTLCKVWGFVKYTHPEIAKGNINWDYELFRILPTVRSKNFQKEVQNWVASLGKVQKQSVKTFPSENAKLKPDTDWITNKSILSKGLSKQLVALQEAKKEDKHFFLDFAPNVGNPVFKNEKAYSKMNASDDGYRLLALFRYWNVIEYFFPYKHLTDEKWNDVLKAHLPMMLNANDGLSYELTLLSLIGKIQDTHANIWAQSTELQAFHGKNIAPIMLKFVGKQAVITNTFEPINKDSKMKVGDVITAIDGVPTQQVVDEKIKYCPASNYPTQLRNVAWRILRTPKETIKLTLKNENGTFEEEVPAVDLRKAAFEEEEILSHKTLDNDIGYIYPGSLKSGEIHEIMADFIHKKGLIVDLRCYPSDFIVFSLSKYLMPEPTEFVTFTKGSLADIGEFSFMDVSLKVGEENKDYYKGKVIILIDESTQSQAEYTTMALRVAPKATVLGSTTAGADGNVSRLILPGKIRTGISGIGIYYPDGTETQRVGIVPDIEMTPTIEGIRSGKDELLEKAIELILEK